MTRFLVAACSAVALLSCPARAGDDLAKRIEAVIDGPDYTHSHWGVLVVNTATGEPVYARNADKLFAPASVTKLYTCAAALVALGPDHRFETTVRQRGLLTNGVVRGDLVLVAGGDLTLGGRTTADGKTAFKDKDHTYANSGLMEAELTDTDPLAGLKSLAKQVKDAGTQEVTGEVAVDDRLFAKTRGSGSGPDLVTPIVVNDNVVDIVIEPGEKPGDPAKVRTRPETAFFQVDAVVTTAAEKSEPDIQVLAISPHVFAVRGKITAGSKPLVRNYPVEDAAGFARTLFIEAMRGEGIRVQAALVRQTLPDLPPKNAYDTMKTLATLRSPPLKDVIAVTLKVSHNLYASTLPALVAVSRDRDTAEAGLREQAKILKDLGVDVESISLGGGAGGTRADYVTPRSAVQLMIGMAKRPEWDAYKAGLPVLGVDGTLADAASESSPAKGKVSAKTGTLYWYDVMNDRYLLNSKALAGVTTTKAGTPLAFAFFVNSTVLPAGVTTSRESKALAKLAEIVYEFGP